MNAEQRMVYDFHNYVGAGTGPEAPSRIAFRAAFVLEEAQELGKAMAEDDLLETIDALCDLLYVVYGTGVSLGIDLEPFFREIHRSNMTKAPAGDGKAIKGPDYQPPSLSHVLLLQAIKRP